MTHLPYLYFRACKCLRCGSLYSNIVRLCAVKLRKFADKIHSWTCVNLPIFVNADYSGFNSFFVSLLHFHAANLFYFSPSFLYLISDIGEKCTIYEQSPITIRNSYSFSKLQSLFLKHGNAPLLYFVAVSTSNFLIVIPRSLLLLASYLPTYVEFR
jgi:hypothetical protein